MSRGANHTVAALTAMLLWVSAAGAADVAIIGGGVDLTISTASAGQQPSPVADESCILQWSTLVTDPTKKITIQSSLSNPKFALTARAVNVSPGDGNSAGTVPVRGTAADLITDIPAGVPDYDPGTCTLRYEASATAGDGTGTDHHTVTFTIVDQ